MENENACSYEDLPLMPNKTEEARLIVASQFSEFWSKYFIKENAVTTSSGTATKNQYYCPDFVTKLKSFYLPTVPLWTKLMEEKIKSKNEHLKLKDLPIRTIYTETNNNAQVEECFKIKKHSSNIKQNINLTEFLELNYHDNCGLFRASAESFIQQVSQMNSKDKKSTCCQKTRIKYNVKKMQQRKKSKHRSLMTKSRK